MLSTLTLTAMMSIAAPPPSLAVSDNGRFLVTADGEPFFWLGDTAWELFHRTTREEADRYLTTRAAQGFTVIQAVALAEVEGLTVPNAYGHRPLADNDPARPLVGDGEDYWDHVDDVVDKAAELGLTIAMLPTWGDKWNLKWGKGPEVFTPENARVYGEWLGKRYADKPIVWVLGGDRPIEEERHAAIIRAMAAGLAAGDGGRHLMTFHPSGGHGSAEWFHNDDWLDFNMRQNGHGNDYARHAKTREDYDRTPIKPVLDGEPLYEDHPLFFKAPEHGHSIAADVRRSLYWDLFSGAFGHTYGHHAVWQMWQPGRSPINNPLMPWHEAIEQPGAQQMQHGRRLLESRPFLTRIPADDVIVPSNVPSAVPGAGRYRFVATRCAEGSYAMVYAPIGRPFTVSLDVLTGETARAWWFNPRSGEAALIGEMPSSGEHEFVSPTPSEEVDWVLVLDDAARGFGAPGGGR